jgi:hypothetical protein
MEAKEAKKEHREHVDTGRQLVHQIGKATDSAHIAWSWAGETVEGLGARMKSNPISTMAGAVGIGYIVGGGFFSPLTRRVVGMGVRVGILLAAAAYLAEGVSNWELSTGLRGAKSRGRA